MIGNSKVSSKSCNWVREYSSFICELVFDGVCLLMGDIVDEK